MVIDPSIPSFPYVEVFFSGWPSTEQIILPFRAPLLDGSGGSWSINSISFFSAWVLNQSSMINKDNPFWFSSDHGVLVRLQWSLVCPVVPLLFSFWDKSLTSVSSLSKTSDLISWRPFPSVSFSCHHRVAIFAQISTFPSVSLFFFFYFIYFESLFVFATPFQVTGA